MKKKLFFALALVCSTAVFAGSLSIASMSFSDGIGNPVEKDYMVSSYKIVGKNMPNKSTIAGQFSREFSEIPYTVDNLVDGDGWNVKVYAYDTNNRLIGQSEDISVTVAGDSSISVDVIVDVPTFTLDNLDIFNNGQLVTVSDAYDVDHYELTFYSAYSDDEIVLSTSSLPFVTTAIPAGRWIVVIDAIDMDGNTIASSGRLSLRLSENGKVSASATLSSASRRLNLTPEGTSSSNGYLYIDDNNSFKVSASVFPLGKNDDVSFRWYVSDEGEWVEIDTDEAFVTYPDIKKHAKNQEVFAILCNPVVDGIEYRGSYIKVAAVPDLIPSLLVTGAAPIDLDGHDNLEATTTSSDIYFIVDLPTYYLGKGVKVYYSLDGSKPTQSSTQAIIGDRIVLSPGDSELNLLIVDPNGKEDRYKVDLSVKQKVSPPSLSISNRDWGQDLYVTLSSRTEGSSIYYTTDGSEPNENSNLYTEPFKVGSIVDRSKVVVKAIAVKDGYENSEITSIKAF